jgi:hypothetical protein
MDPDKPQAPAAHNAKRVGPARRHAAGAETAVRHNVSISNR